MQTHSLFQNFSQEKKSIQRYIAIKVSYLLFYKMLPLILLHLTETLLNNNHLSKQGWAIYFLAFYRSTYAMQIHCATRILGNGLTVCYAAALVKMSRFETTQYLPPFTGLL